MRATAHGRRIDERVGAVASDDADENAARRPARSTTAVSCAAMEVDEKLNRFARVEAPREELLPSDSSSDVDESVISTRHDGAIGAVAAMNRDALCEKYGRIRPPPSGIAAQLLLELASRVGPLTIW